MYLASMKNIREDMLSVVKQILKSFALDINIQDIDGNTTLHVAIISMNKSVFKEILLNSSSKPNLGLKNKLEETPLWLSLVQSESTGKLIELVLLLASVQLSNELNLIHSR